MAPASVHFAVYCRLMTFGNLFREIRKGSGKSMGDVARHLGISVTYLSDVERGERPALSPERIRDACGFMQCSDGDVTRLLSSAAAGAGAFKLPMPASLAGREAGAALMRGFDHLDDDAYRAIVDIMEKGKGPA